MDLVLTRSLSQCTEDATPGSLSINGKPFSFTLEDARRGAGIKVYGKTCVPPGRYRVVVTLSNRFQKMMPLFYNTAEFAVENEGIRFTGCRVHGGAHVGHTEGCILVAYDKYNPETKRISRTASPAFTAKLEAAQENGEEIWLNIIEK